MDTGTGRNLSGNRGAANSQASLMNQKKEERRQLEHLARCGKKVRLNDRNDERLQRRRLLTEPEVELMDVEESIPVIEIDTDVVPISTVSTLMTNNDAGAIVPFIPQTGSSSQVIKEHVNKCAYELGHNLEKIRDHEMNIAALKYRNLELEHDIAVGINVGIVPDNVVVQLAAPEPSVIFLC